MALLLGGKGTPISKQLTIVFVLLEYHIVIHIQSLKSQQYEEMY